MTRQSPVVLVVDDDHAFAELTAAHLRRALPDVTVDVTVNPERVLDRLDGCCAVVSDHDMPGMTGLCLLEAVRRRDADLPFVLFTGSSSGSVRSRADAADVTAYVEKDGARSFTAVADAVSGTI